jgi:hypothetical protein
MDILQENAGGMAMEDVITTSEKIRQWIEGFVDDTSLSTNLKYGKTNTTKLLELAEKDGQTWERMLNVSGGELELKKCFYYVLSWKWDTYGNPRPQEMKEQQLKKLSIKLSTTKETVELTQKEVLDSHKTLGTFKCIYGKEETQYQELVNKSNKISELASQG